MKNIKIKVGSKFVLCSVNELICRKRKCFNPGYYIHRCGWGFETAKKMSCLTRDNHGCPEKKEIFNAIRQKKQ